MSVCVYVCDLCRSRKKGKPVKSRHGEIVEKERLAVEALLLLLLRACSSWKEQTREGGRCRTVDRQEVKACGKSRDER